MQAPGDLMLTGHTARQQSRLGDLMEQHGLPAWSAIALFLVELSRQGGCGRGQPGVPAAEWGPWLSALPRSTGCVLEWTQQVRTGAAPPALPNTTLLSKQWRAP